MKRLFLLVILFILLFIPASLSAQGELAATLEVISAGVEVQRVNTTQFIPVSVEAIVGVGDVIRTDDKGRARVIFFADGTDTELLPNTEYQIDRFEGANDSFNLTVTVLTGQTIQRLNRLLDSNSSYDVNTPGMELTARGTNFRIRVEDDGRSAMLVTEGNVGAGAQDSEAAVEPGFGIRTAIGESLSDVVAATSFEELDAALDGCTAIVTTPDDVSLNVRLSPSLEAPRVGVISAAEITLFKGITASSGWYRIDFRGNFGWILASDVVINTGCAGLRRFPDTWAGEDPRLYESLGDNIRLEDLPLPEVTPEATPDATPEASSN